MHFFWSLHVQHNKRCHSDVSYSSINTMIPGQITSRLHWYIAIRSEPALSVSCNPNIINLPNCPRVIERKNRFPISQPNIPMQFAVRWSKVLNGNRSLFFTPIYIVMLTANARLLVVTRLTTTLAIGTLTERGQTPDGSWCPVSVARHSQQPQWLYMDTHQPHLKSSWLQLLKKYPAISIQHDSYAALANVSVCSLSINKTLVICPN